MQPVKILHLDDHRLFFQGIRVLTERISPKINMVHCTNHVEAIAIIQEAENSGKPFQLILTDINHPEGNGIEFCRQVAALTTNKIPLGIISMVYDEPAATSDHYAHVRNPKIRELLEEGLLRFVCSKSANSEVITHLLELNLPDLKSQ